MSTLDAISKRYLSDNHIFADVFNYIIYDGEPIIKPESLSEVDTTEIAVPYGNNAHFVVQRYRDLKKIWSAKFDGKRVYVLLAGEIQQKVHYAQPVRDMLYNAISFTKQVEEAGRSYRREDTGEFSIENGTLKIKLTSEEFLSGFKKTDRLIPIITVDIYLGAGDWDGPLSIHDMLDESDPRVLRLIPNHAINLLTPARIDEPDFDKKFHTDLGIALKLLKHQGKGIVEAIRGLNHRKVGRPTAEFVNAQAKLQLKFEEPAEEGEVDMCKAMQDYWDGMQVENIKALMRNVHFTPEQAFAALEVPTTDQERLAGMLKV